MKYFTVIFALLIFAYTHKVKAQIDPARGLYNYGHSCTSVHKNANCDEARQLPQFYVYRNATVHISYFPPNATDAADAKRSCSGTLIFQQFDGGDMEFYVLSAAHCQVYPDDKVSETDILFTFNFQYPVCNTTPQISPQLKAMVNPYIRATRGATIVARGNWRKAEDYAEDYILYKLKKDLSPIIFRDDIAVCFGCIHPYQTPDELPTQAFSFHHPKGDVKKFSLDEDFSLSPINRDFTKPYYQVQSEIGVYQNGSSGCALFGYDTNTERTCIIGILSAGSLSKEEEEKCDAETLKSQTLKFVRINNEFLQSSRLGDFIPTAITTENELAADNLCFARGTSCFNGGEPDGDETSTDCGGNCPPCEEHCYSGRKDGNEDGVDCGGDCLPCHCFNGKTDADETRTDCGGKDCPPCRPPVGIGDGETCQILTTAPKIIVNNVPRRVTFRHHPPLTTRFNQVADRFPDFPKIVFAFPFEDFKPD